MSYNLPSSSDSKTIHQVTWIESQYEPDISSETLQLILNETTASVIKPEHEKSSLLFDIHKKAPSWAQTEPPINQASSSKRCFNSLGILPFFDLESSLKALGPHKGRYKHQIDLIESLCFKIEELTSIVRNIYLNRSKFQKG